MGWAVLWGVARPGIAIECGCHIDSRQALGGKTRRWDRDRIFGFLVRTPAPTLEHPPGLLQNKRVGLA